jgi:hypothetical protein
MRYFLLIIALMGSYESVAQLKHLIYLDCSQNNEFAGLSDLSQESGRLIDSLISSNDDFIVFLSNGGDPQFYYKNGRAGVFDKGIIFQKIRNTSPSSPDTRFDIGKIMNYIDKEGIRIDQSINYYFFSSIYTLTSRDTYTPLIEGLVHVMNSEPRDRSSKYVSVYIANKNIYGDSAKYHELLLDYPSSTFNY